MSRLWLTPGIRRLVAQKLAWIAVLDQCQYGTSYSKRTSLLVWGVPEHAFSSKLCSGANGRCSRTQKKHVHLAGQSKGVFLTRAAQAYPQQMAQAIAEAFVDSRQVAVSSSISPKCHAAEQQYPAGEGLQGSGGNPVKPRSSGAVAPQQLAVDSSSSSTHGTF